LKYTLPLPNDELIGKKLLIINTTSNNWKIVVAQNGKIGGQNERQLNKMGQSLTLICDGEKYYSI